MRKNLPVTEREHPFPAGKILVSKTDLKGVITYANDAFVQVSGFTEEELLSRAHNIVRHPTMPPAAFEDLWNTVKAGKPWRGVVKNRRKDGDHYWVDATVVPVRKNNETIGYMSVRKQPSRAQIDSAESVYAGMSRTSAPLRKPGFLQRLFSLPLFVQYSACVVALMLLTSTVWALSRYQMHGYVDALIAVQLVGLAASMVYFKSNISQPLVSAMRHFDAMAQGNLNTEIDITRPGDMGALLASLAYMQAHFRVITDEIRGVAGRISGQTAAALAEVGNVSGQSAQQSERVSEVSAAMEELAVSSSEVAERAISAAAAAKSSFATVAQGKHDMAESMTTSRRVVQASTDTDRVLAELGQAVQTISSVTRVIAEVATQTNLLALNASIEAARAGENGRGFAVVADEVRKLAERTRTSTGEIERLISAIQSLSGQAVNSMKSALSGVLEEQRQLQDAERGFTQIEGASGEVVELADQIAWSAKEQSSANENIARSMEAMATLIEHNMQSVRGVQLAVEGATRAIQTMEQLLLHFQEGDQPLKVS
jgi:aerotaxis receptor